MTVFNANTFQLLVRKAAGGYGYLFGVDVVAKVLAASNLLDVSVASTAPGDTTKLWFQPDSVTPAAGAYKIYDAISASWVPLTFVRFAAWLVGRGGVTPAPTGSVQAYAGAAAPAGWLLCNGAAVNRTTYAALYAITGDTFGPGNGTTTFNLPDLRGEFIRGTDTMGTARGVDAGRALGSQQAGMVGPHGHPMRICSPPMPGGSNGVGGFLIHESINANYPANDGPPSDPAGNQLGINLGTETRPRNVALAYIIKT
ncbi:phage tail protein [Labrys wisconsinensis]|uniref:Phage tail collar domain-containing protein n=1 Tax=Labrys wisconsinensis TaxID=425677 RepID=A0ABU0JEW8_9HYPH|nr:phage tail protein [Labrys wisconsinensis]MDQ0472827.1 hypothetical protein [Labrys wisconsinensis]